MHEFRAVAFRRFENQRANVRSLLRSLLDRIGLLAQNEGMRHAFPILLGAGLALRLAAGAARAAGFDAYEVILERQPFGTPAAEKAPDTSAMPPPEAFVLGYKMTAITRDEAGFVNVGIVDQKTKKSYLLSPGEIEDGLFIGGVEIENGEAQLCKGAEKYWMSLSTGGVTTNSAARLAATNKPPVKAAAAIVTPAPPPPSPFFASSRIPRSPSSSLTKLSYAERKKLRDDLRRRTAEAQQLAAAKTTGTVADATPSNMPPPAVSADEDLPALLAAAGVTNRASLVSLLEQIGYTNADAVVESEPVE